MALNTSFKKYLISPNELFRKKKINIRIIDCRWYLEDNKKGLKEFLKSHIKNSIFLDIEKLSGNSDLPHMLPSSIKFNKFINSNGLNYNNEIIIYDQTGFFCSSRVWFMFCFFGFKNVKILNGGIKNWKIHKFPLSKLIKKKRRSFTYISEIKTNLLINKCEITQLLKSESKLHKIIDARPRNRFLGEKGEPRKGLRKGNIKFSINIPFSDIIKKNGTIKSNVELRSIISKNMIKEKHTIICYCGSGITACNLIFAFNIIGLSNTKLYDGSWAEWGKK